MERDDYIKRALRRVSKKPSVVQLKETSNFAYCDVEENDDFQISNCRFISDWAHFEHVCPTRYFKQYRRTSRFCRSIPARDCGWRQSWYLQRRFGYIGHKLNRRRYFGSGDWT